MTVKRAKPFPFTQDYLRSRLHYDRRTGVFTWKYHPDMPDRWNTRWSGKTAGNVNDNGYVIIIIDYVHYRAHRLAWFYVYGEQPPEIDHIKDGFESKSDNRLKNLRPATRSQNSCNKIAYGNNTSGYKGVSWSKVAQKWEARISYQKIQYYLGLFDSPEEAHRVYANAAKKLHDEYARCKSDEIKSRFRPMDKPFTKRRLENVSF